MLTVKKTPFEQASAYLRSSGIAACLSDLPRSVTDTVREVRIRTGQPVTLEYSGSFGELKRLRVGGSVKPEQVELCIREFCGNSVHSYERQFREGWLTLCGGHRAGFTGTAVVRGGKVENLRNISAVNLRIARQHVGSAEELHSLMFGGGSGSDDEECGGLLITGAPLSAKTTVLRDLCRLISAEHKVALIDERSELAAVYNGTPTLDVGENTDVLDNFPKGQGIMTALRSLSPEYIFCDEIGFESAEVAEAANSGVRLVLTAHSGDLRQAYSASRIRTLLESGGITHIAVLGSGKNIGKVQWYGTNKCELSNVGGGSRDRNSNGAVFFMPPENARRAAAGTHTRAP